MRILSPINFWLNGDRHLAVDRANWIETPVSTGWPRSPNPSSGKEESRGGETRPLFLNRNDRINSYNKEEYEDSK